MRRTAALLTVVALAACAKPETPEMASARMQAEADSARTAIEALNASWSRYLAGNHPDSMAMLYMEGGVMMPPNGAAATGRAAIQAAMTAQPFPAGATIAFTTADVAANGPIAVERGTFAINMPAEGRRPAMTMTGKYISHWHKVDGQWKVAADIWNDDPPPTPTPTR